MNQLLKTKQDILRHKRPNFSFPCRECKKLGNNESMSYKHVQERLLTCSQEQGCTFNKNVCLNRELFDPLDWEAYEVNQAPATSSWHVPNMFQLHIASWASAMDNDKYSV